MAAILARFLGHLFASWRLLPEIISRKGAKTAKKAKFLCKIPNFRTLSLNGKTGKIWTLQFFTPA